MYKRIALLITLTILLFGQSYTVDLEGDGSVCQQYSYTDTVNNMISGVICEESK